MKSRGRWASRLLRAAAALSIGAALTLSAPAPAQAETLNANCESGELCLYWLTNYGPPIADMYDSVPDYGPWHFAASSAWLNDNTYSGKNRAFWNCARVSMHANYVGFTLVFDPNFWIGDFNDPNHTGGTNFRDQASSHKFSLNCS